MTSNRLFDAAIEEPDLLLADRKARAARRGRRDAARAPSPPDHEAIGPSPPPGEHRVGPEASNRKRRAEPGRRRERGGSRADRTGEAGTARTGTMIDPRIAARRARVTAEAAAAAPRLGRRLGVVTICLGIALSAAGLVLLSPLAAVSSIEVGGALRTGSAAVRRASGLGDRPPLLRIDEDQVAARVAALPWVRRARVERRWPRTVAIVVEERRPAALAPCRADGGDSCMVDATGRVLGPASDDPKLAAGLPRLAGVPPSGAPGTKVPEVALGPLAVAVAMPDALGPLVAQVRGDGPEVALDLSAPGRRASPPVVRLGPPDRIPDKLTAAATVLARTSVNGVDVLDVRVPESPALTRIRR